MDRNLSWFKYICNINRFEVSDENLTKLEKYVQLLLAWNSRINLISRKDENNIWIRHILGSIAFLFHAQTAPRSKIVDVGTGGGLPGIPLAILFSDLHITLLDSIQKKMNAVDDIIKQLQLNNVNVVCGRAEELSNKKEFYRTYDYVVCRAVAPAKDIVRWCRNFLRNENGNNSNAEHTGKKWINKGSIILLKGGNLEQETSEVRIKFTPRSVESFNIIVNGVTEDELSEKKILIVKP